VIKECRIWLLPPTPFVVVSHYNGRNIYSPEARADFATTYTKEISGRIFDQWQCKRNDAGPRKRG